MKKSVSHVILNLNLYFELLELITEQLSAVKELSNNISDSSGSEQVELFIRHIGGKRTHHQFFPSAFPIFIFNPS